MKVWYRRKRFEFIRARSRSDGDGAGACRRLRLIQPARLRPYLSDVLEHGPTDDGLPQRFQLLIWPDAPREWKLVDQKPDAKAAESFRKVCERLSALSAENPVYLTFAPDAQELFFAWWPELEQKIRGDSGLAPSMVAHLAKYRSLMPTLAGLFELVDLAASGAELGQKAEISLAHAQQAAAFCAYLEQHARRVYSCVTSPEIAAAHELARAIRHGDLADEFTTREVYRHGWSGLGTPEKTRAALEVLEDAAWVRCVDNTTSSQHGRPTEKWNINPKLKKGKTA